jgi:integrase
MYWKHGAYYYVKSNRWQRLSDDYYKALRKYIDLESPSSDWSDLLTIVYDRYLERYEAGDLSKNTLDQYAGIRPRIEAAFSEYRIHEINSRHIVQFMDAYEDTPNLANRMLSVLRVAFDKAVRLGACDTNPASTVKRFPERRRTRYITDKELGLLLSHAKQELRSIIALCYLTGQRVGDIISLEWEQVTDDGIAFEQQKTKTRLLVQMTDDIRKALPERKGVYVYPYKSTHTSYYSVRDRFRRLVAATGVHHCTLHDIRAKALTDVKKAGGDAQALAGHSLESTTVRYIRDRETPVVSGPSLDTPLKA